MPKLEFPLCNIEPLSRFKSLGTSAAIRLRSFYPPTGLERRDCKIAAAASQRVTLSLLFAARLSVPLTASIKSLCKRQ